MKRLVHSILGRLVILVVLAFALSQFVILALHYFQIGHNYRTPDGPPHLDGTRLMPPPPSPPLRIGPLDTPVRDVLIDQLVQLAVVLLAAGIGARMIARPIRLFSEAAGRMGIDLNAAPLDEQDPLEVREAAQVLNQLQAQLQRQIRERQQTLAAISHDLRTPLTRMKLRAEQINDPGLKDKLRADMEDMTQLLDSTLDFLYGESRVEVKQLLDIQALVEAIAENEQECGHSVQVSGTAAPIPAYPILLQRVMQNIISNAIRYGMAAEVRLDDSPVRLVIQVADTGPGVPDADLARILEPFVRLEPSRNKATGGVGLGLTIAADGIARHGGKFQLRNPASGGLLVEIVLPR